MAARVRVLPPTSKRGLIALSGVLGACHGLLGAWTVTALQSRIFGFGGSMSTFGFFRTFAFIAVTFLLPAIPVAMLFARVHPRLGRLFACGALYGAACLLGTIAVTLAVNPQVMLTPWEPHPDGLVDTVLQIAVGLIFAFVVFVAGFETMFGIGAAVERFLGKHIVVQTGLVCWSCGYDLGAANLTLCPECGGGFDPAAASRAKSHRILGLVLRMRMPLLAVCLIGAAAPAVYQVFAFAISAARFLQACPKGARLQRAGMMGNYVWRSDADGSYRSVVMPIEYGWWIPDQDSQTHGIVVQFLPRSVGVETQMFVSRSCLVNFTVPAGVVIAGPIPKFQYAEPGIMHVRARLSPEQARRVIDSGGVPEGLIEALRNQARQAGWAEADVTVAPATNIREVDPLPWFPGTTPAAADGMQ